VWDMEKEPDMLSLSKVTQGYSVTGRYAVTGSDKLATLMLSDVALMAHLWLIFTSSSVLSLFCLPSASSSLDRFVAVCSQYSINMGSSIKSLMQSRKLMEIASPRGNRALDR
jgi:hypothetical protein